MPSSLSERIVASYLLCKTKAALTFAGESGSQSEYEALTKDASDAVRDKFLGQFASGSILDRVVLDRKILRAGAAVITNGSINYEGSLYAVDLLVRKRGDSVLGNFHYIPALFYGGYSNPPHARQILSLTGSKLAPLQKLAPKHGLVINAASETRTVALPNKPSETKKLLIGIEAVRNELPKLQLNSHCAICEFRTRCEARAKQDDDLSLLKGIAPKSIQKLRRRGIFTVFQYAHTYRARRSHSGATDVPRQHALQAMAVRDQKLYVIGKPELPQSTSSVYLDFEGDPERSFVYLIGAQVCNGGTKQQFSFWADDSDDEPKIVERLYQLLSSLDSFQAYCYGSYESANLKRWADSAVGKSVCDLLLPQLTNILGVIYRHLYLPTHSNGLKDIASALGYAWRTPNASGALSVLWRRHWERCRTSSHKQRLVEYNADDCSALSMVTEVIRSIDSDTPTLPWPQEDIENQATRFERPSWETTKFEIDEFEIINRRAYFDYQRDRIFIRAGKRRRSKRFPATKKHRHGLRPTERLEFEAQKCPVCVSSQLDQIRDGRIVRVQYDLKITPSGMRRVVRHATAREVAAAIVGSSSCLRSTND